MQAFRFSYKSKNIWLTTTFVIAVLMLIGIVRVVLEVELGIILDSKWFSYEPDILFVMAFYPVYLCFFLWFVVATLLQLMEIRFSHQKLFSFFFWIQFLHLLIPFGDYIAITYGIPWNHEPLLNSAGMMSGFTISPFFEMPNLLWFPVYFTPAILFFTNVTTFGINIAWLLSGIAFLWFFKKKLVIRWGATLILMLVLFQVIYWPVYKYHFVFNLLFDNITHQAVFTHYGYGLFFLFLSALGVWAYLQTSKEQLTRTT